MSIRDQRLQLIRERHRRLILAAREQAQLEAFNDEWDDFDYFDEDEDISRFAMVDEDEG